MVIKPI